MPQSLRIGLVLVLLGVIIGVPLWYRGYRARSFRNFHIVEHGILYRSGQLSLAELKSVVERYQIKSVVSLRDGEKPIDAAEEEYLLGIGVKFVRISPLNWSTSEGAPPIHAGLATFRSVMSDRSNHPVLIHCFAGQHRTGAYCAVYRMDFHGWTNADAMKEMRNLGYYTIDTDEDVRDFLKSYRTPVARSQAP